MDLGNRLQRWWDRVRGYEPPAARPVDHAARRKAATPAAQPIRPVAGTEPGESLKLSVEGKPTQGSRKPGHGGAGFDPYSSTGGYGKPRGWDDVPRK